MPFGMEKFTCCTCQKPKATLECGICKDYVCKNCAHFLDDDSFSFMAQIPADLAHGTYCIPCFDSKVASELESYNETMEQAKNIHVFEKDQGKETRFFKRLEKPIKVENCPDRKETLLRLAFFAVKGGFNTLIDVDVTSAKIRSGTYQTQIWTGSGIPTTVEERRLNRKDRVRSPSRR